MAAHLGHASVVRDPEDVGDALRVVEAPGDVRRSPESFAKHILKIVTREAECRGVTSGKGVTSAAHESGWRRYGASGRTRFLVVTVLSALLVGSGPVQAVGHHDRAAHGAAPHAKKHLTKKGHLHKKKHPGRKRPGRGSAAAVRPVTETPVPPSAAPTAATAVPTDPVTSGVLPAGWLTTRDGMRRLDPLTAPELSASGSRSAVHVTVDDTTRYQSMDGFGAALTESSAHLLMQLSATARTAALRSLFDPVTGAGMDLVRLPLGASDFALSRYTYDDVPAGQTDPDLSRFTLGHDDAEIVPVLQEALRINPSLRVMGTPWTAPAWMKTNESLVGGTLRDGYADVYADYLVRTVQALRDRHVPIRFLTLGNEPRYAPADYPGMLLSPPQEATLADGRGRPAGSGGHHRRRS